MLTGQQRYKVHNAACGSQPGVGLIWWYPLTISSSAPGHDRHSRKWSSKLPASLAAGSRRALRACQLSAPPLLDYCWTRTVRLHWPPRI